MSTAIEQKIMPLIRLFNHHQVRDRQTLDLHRILADPKATELVITSFVHEIQSSQNMDHVIAIVCVESQGFLFGPLVAARLNLPCIVVRKEAKLAGEVVKRSYVKWDGKDSLEIQKQTFADIGYPSGTLGTDKGVIVIDGSLASGGTVACVKGLIEELGTKLLKALFVVSLSILHHERERRENLDGLEVYGLVNLTEKELAKMPMHQGMAPKGEDSRTKAHVGPPS